MKKKICIVTGANSGIGFELALGMAKKNYCTILVCRNKESADIAKRKIIGSTNNTDVHVRIADLSSQKSIRQFVESFNSEFTHLDVLINNAGANFFTRQITEDDIEMTWAINYLAPYLLTKLLLPKIKKSESARIILTVGGISKKTTIQFDDIGYKTMYNVIQASAQAILTKLLFCFELNKRLKDSNITVNCFHPGATKTKLQKKMPVMWKILIGLMKPFFHSAKKGAETGFFLATSNELNKISGKYYKNQKEMHLPAYSQNPEIAHQLWELSKEMTNN